MRAAGHLLASPATRPDQRRRQRPWSVERRRRMNRRRRGAQRLSWPHRAPGGPRCQPRRSGRLSRACRRAQPLAEPCGGPASPCRGRQRRTTRSASFAAAAAKRSEADQPSSPRRAPAPVAQPCSARRGRGRRPAPPRGPQGDRPQPRPPRRAPRARHPAPPARDRTAAVAQPRPPRRAPAPVAQRRPPRRAPAPVTQRRPPRRAPAPVTQRRPPRRAPAPVTQPRPPRRAPAPVTQRRSARRGQRCTLGKGRAQPEARLDAPPAADPSPSPRHDASTQRNSTPVESRAATDGRRAHIHPRIGPPRTPITPAASPPEPPGAPRHARAAATPLPQRGTHRDPLKPSTGTGAGTRRRHPSRRTAQHGSEPTLRADSSVMAELWRLSRQTRDVLWHPRPRRRYGRTMAFLATNSRRLMAASAGCDATLTRPSRPTRYPNSKRAIVEKVMALMRQNYGCPHDELWRLPQQRYRTVITTP